MMKRRGIMVVVALALLVPVFALPGCTGAGATTVSIPDVNLGGQQHGIWVSGRGEVQATPDIAIINLGVQTQAQSVSVAQRQANEAMDKVMVALTANGIAEKDIKTTGFNIWQQSRWDPDTQQEIVTGYQVSNNIEAKIRDVDSAGDVLDAVVTQGGDYIRVNGIQFEVDDPSGYLEQAREKAMADAKGKASQLADLADVALGKPTFITEGSQTSPVYVSRGYAMDDGMESAGAPSISPGQTTIVATVQIAYRVD